MPPLPIEPLIPDLLAALRAGPNAVLQAPPGAGKTTRVPLALLDEPWLAGCRVVLLEPRRLAVRAAAARMAALLGEAVGETVGYRVRLDACIGPRTRIEVVTEGVLTRRLQTDPALEGIGAVLLDEFHERSLDADLALALCLETQQVLRHDLRLLVMSATLADEPIAALMGGAPILRSAGRSHPVTVRHRPTRSGARADDAAVAAVRDLWADLAGDVLVFLPGEAEIRRAAARLEDDPPGPEALIAPLYGALPAARQDAAIRPAPAGRRKIVLATAIAETSLTIEGVGVVVDSGWRRAPRFDPARGLTRLETLRISRAAADQRAGRAGRTGPGHCVRLWDEAAHRLLPAFDRPEIAEADLAPLALDLANWGAAPEQLAWLDPPPAPAFAEARALLRWLGAIDGDGRITPHGKRLAALPMHPRLAHMVVAAQALRLAGLACDLAAALSERDILKAEPGYRDSDLRLRLAILRDPKARPPAGLTVDRSALQQARAAARDWRRRLGARDGGGRGAGDTDHADLDGADLDEAGRLLALAYPDRVGRRRQPGGATYLLTGGRGAVLSDGDSLCGTDWLTVAALDAGGRNARIFLAAPLTGGQVEALFADRIEADETVAWDAAAGAVLARRRRRLGAVMLSEEPSARVAPARIAEAALDAVRAHGLGCLPWTAALLAWRQRVLFLRAHDADPARWADLSDETLSASLDGWLSPFLMDLPRRDTLRAVPLEAALQALVPWALQQELAVQAPTRIAVPSGSRVPLHYDDARPPVLAVRLQEMFGLAETPRVAWHRVPVVLHLLSPAGRPVQVTQDLASFWAHGYAAVKAELRGRYPRHVWPDDPLQAAPTRRAKRRTG